MTQLHAYGIINDRKTFVEGVTAFRNARDLAKQSRDTFIQTAHSRYQAGTRVAEEASTVTAKASSEHDPSSDEFVDCEARTQKTSTDRHVPTSKIANRYTCSQASDLVD